MDGLLKITFFFIALYSSFANGAAFCPSDEPASSWNECYGSSRLSDGTVYDGIWMQGMPADATESFDNNQNFSEPVPSQRSASASDMTGLSLLSTGSGFAVSETALITNAHVVKDCDALKAYRVGLVDWIKLTVLNIDPKNDLALLHSSQNLENFFTFSNTPLVLSAEAFAAGFPANISTEHLINLDVKITRGIVSSLTGINANTFFLDAALNPGNSGGPITDASAKVIGVAVAMVPETNNGFIAINAKTVLNFLEASRVQANFGEFSYENAEDRHKLFAEAVYFLGCFKN
jgi:S1-C subfamily serine protease